MRVMGVGGVGVRVTLGNRLRLLDRVGQKEGLWVGAAGGGGAWRVTLSGVGLGY